MRPHPGPRKGSVLVAVSQWPGVGKGLWKEAMCLVMIISSGPFLPGSQLRTKEQPFRFMAEE